MSRIVTLAWGSIPGDGQHQAKVSSIQELDAVLDRVHAQALADGLPQQVDAMTQGLTIEPRGHPDQLVQFLLGHPGRGAVRWHEPTDSYQALEPDLTLLPEPVLYDDGGAVNPMDPGDLRLTPQATRRIIADFVATGARPSDVVWTRLI